MLTAVSKHGHVKKANSVKPEPSRFSQLISLHCKYLGTADWLAKRFMVGF